MATILFDSYNRDAFGSFCSSFFFFFFRNESFFKHIYNNEVRLQIMEDRSSVVIMSCIIRGTIFLSLFYILYFIFLLYILQPKQSFFPCSTVSFIEFR